MTDGKALQAAMEEASGDMGASDPAEPVPEGEAGGDMGAAIAEDMMNAIAQGDAALLGDIVNNLIDYIRE